MGVEDLGGLLCLDNDLKNHPTIGIEELRTDVRGQQRCHVCANGYTTEMCKTCMKYLCQKRRKFTLPSGRVVVGSCNYLWHTEEDILQFKKLKGEKL